jgi:deoxyadenosine/deoxycytidine kinase
MRVCIEGLMGVGKSSLCSYLSQFGTYIPEPRLGGFGVGFHTEMQYFLARKEAWDQNAAQDGIVFFDRSVFTSNVFWTPEYSYENLSFDELQLLLTAKEALLSEEQPNTSNLPNLIVWLRASVFTCSRRIIERADFDEDTDIGYLCRLEASYIDTMNHLKSLGVPVLEVDCDYDVHGEDREVFYDNLYNIILNELNPKKVVEKSEYL